MNDNTKKLQKIVVSRKTKNIIYKKNNKSYKFFIDDLSIK